MYQSLDIIHSGPFFTSKLHFFIYKETNRFLRNCYFIDMSKYVFSVHVGTASFFSVQWVTANTSLNITITIWCFLLVFQVRRYSVSIPPVYQPLSQARHQWPWQALPMSNLRSQIHAHSKPEAAYAHTLRYVKWGKWKLNESLGIDLGTVWDVNMMCLSLSWKTP